MYLLLLNELFHNLWFHLPTVSGIGAKHSVVSLKGKAPKRIHWTTVQDTIISVGANACLEYNIDLHINFRILYEIKQSNLANLTL